MDRYSFCTMLLLSGHLCWILTVSAQIFSTTKGQIDMIGNVTIPTKTTLSAKGTSMASQTRTPDVSHTTRAPQRNSTTAALKPSVTYSSFLHTLSRSTTTVTTQSMKNMSWTPVTPGNVVSANLTSPSATRTRNSHQPIASTLHIITATQGSTTAAMRATVSVALTNGMYGTHKDTPPTQAPGNSLVMLAFGVMSFILLLVIVMVILVTAVNIRGRCNSTKDEDKKRGNTVLSVSNAAINGEKESITLLSVKTINTETDTDSAQISSVHSTTLDNED